MEILAKKGQFAILVLVLETAEAPDRGVSGMFSLLYNLFLRTTIIVSVTDAIIFYLIATKNVRVLRFGYGTLAFLVIVVTLVPLLINIWFVLWRYGLLNV